MGTCEAVSTSPSAPTAQAISFPPTPDKASQVLRDDEQMELEALVDDAAELAEAAKHAEVKAELVEVKAEPGIPTQLVPLCADFIV